MKITAFVPTYNEEKRIRYCLKCLQWCDEIFVLDKSSSDRTVDVAQEMGAVVRVIPHEDGYDPHENDYIAQLNTDWVVLFTCSDLIDKELAFKVKKTLETTQADVIYVPFKQFVLGICHKKSPWHNEFRRLAFRKSSMKINYSSVHGALYFDGAKICHIKEGGYMYHLTHRTVDGMMDRHIRYWRGEANGYKDEKPYKAFRSILRTFKNDFLRGSYWSGWDIFMLSCANMAYSLMSFVYIWEKKKSHAKEIYDQLMESKYKEWDIK